MKNLVFEISTEHEHLTGVVEWSRGLAQAILARHTVLEGLCEEDASIKSLSYFGDIDLYETHKDFDEYVEGQEDERPRHMFDEPWHLFDEPFPLGEKIRLADVSLVLDKYGTFYWKMIPKHSSDVIETTGLSLGSTQGLFDELSFVTQKEEK